jgi:hypothetical protein
MVEYGVPDMPLLRAKNRESLMIERRKMTLTMMMIIQLFIYLVAELNSQWPITESARTKTL